MPFPLDSHMVDVVMRGEDIGNLYTRSDVHTVSIVKVPDVVTTPERLLLTRPGSLHRHELWENQVKEMDQPRKGDSLQEFSEEREQSFRSVSQIAHTHQVSKLHFCAGLVSLFHMLRSELQEDLIINMFSGRQVLHGAFHKCLSSGVSSRLAAAAASGQRNKSWLS